MINENFITKVIQVLLEMRLDEGFVKRRNKAKAREKIKTMAEKHPSVDTDAKQVRSGRLNRPQKSNVKDSFMNKAADYRIKAKQAKTKDASEFFKGASKAAITRFKDVKNPSKLP